VVLECLVSAWPQPVNYWEKDGRVIEPDKSPRHIVKQVKEREMYQYRMILNVTLVSHDDVGTYYCVSKNEMGITRGNIQVYKRDPNRPPPPKVTGALQFEYFGDREPALTGHEDVCPKPPKCPNCAHESRSICGEAAKIFGIGILAFDQSLPGITNRTEDCTLETIGKPVYHRYTADEHGGWLMDPTPRDPEDFFKIWTTSGSKAEKDRINLMEFSDKEKYRGETVSKNHTLKRPYMGNANVVYNGSFYYFNKQYEAIVKYDLATKEEICLQIPREKQRRKEKKKACHNLKDRDDTYMAQLYPEMGGQVFVDLAVDENGLWALMAFKENNHTGVLKISDHDLELQYMWNISLNHNLVADMFIVCGVLYAVDKTDAQETKIRLALDLYTHRMIPIELPFTNPFRHTTMLGYNHRLQSLYTWDGGNQLTYPVKYHDIGYRELPPVTAPPDRTGAFTGRPQLQIENVK